MGLKRFGKLALFASASILVVAAASFAWLKLAPRVTPPGQPPLARLDAHSLPSFFESFNAGAPDARVLVLLSPT